MRAVRLHAVGEPLHVEEVPMPEPAGTEIRIRVAGCGVCHTDLHVVDGIQTRVELPVTLGHEVAGWIDAIGPSAEGPMQVGDAVVVHGAWGCGECGECRSGADQRCARSVAPGFQADGGYADAMLVPHPRHLVPLQTLDPVRAAPLADAGITPFRAVRRAERWLVPGARVLLIGSGGLGQFAIQYLRLVPDAGSELVIGVSELSSLRMARARELGAGIALSAAEPATWTDALGGRADVVLDFVGTDATLAGAAAAVAPDGLVMLVGEAGGSVAFGFDHLPVEAWLTTVAWGSHDDLRRVVDLAESGQLQWEVDGIPLADATTAHERLRAGDVRGRLVLVP
ncbi:MAG: alcohol dehydrogenase, propanol-preferring [Chloroflexota bacterium]|jgi:propanol-preferring alcohol dehydrogenase|nr:alcohol dehydrogenase, propanol-preferring [Chloroflexota bacterium]